MINNYNILIFSRRRHFEQRNSFIKKIFPNSILINCSDEKKIFQSSINHIFWKYNWSGNFNYNNEVDYNNIIIRCRLLRELNYNKSFILINKALSIWEELLINRKINIVYAPPIDSYTLHCLYIVCKKNNIKFFSLVSSFIDNRVRITNFGELKYNKSISFTDDEVKNFIQNTRKETIKPKWLIGNNEFVYKLILKRFLIDTLKPFLFFLYRLFFNDYDTFSFPKFKYYRKRMISTAKRMFISFIIEKKSISPNDVKSNYIFIPLQFYPEVTSDYWNSDINMINHHKIILTLVNSLSNYKIIVKEHPASIGRRSYNFLKSLSIKENVYFAELNSSINEWLINSILVIGNASTTTVNAIILNKPVLFISKPYFQIYNSLYLESLDSEYLNQMVLKSFNNTYNEEQLFKFVSQFYLNSAIGSLGNYKPIGENNNTNEINVSEDLKKYIYNYLEL